MQPVVHGAAAEHEHLEFLAGFGEVGGQSHAAETGFAGGDAEEGWDGGVGRVWGKSNGAGMDGQCVECLNGFLDEDGRFLAESDAGEFEEGVDSEGRGGAEAGAKKKLGNCSQLLKKR